MRKFYNERHAEMENTASDLDILRELKKRGALDEKLRKALEHLDWREKGLHILLKQLNKYAKEHWLYMTNVSLSQDNTLNCHFLLMTSTDLYTFEIIHYDGLYDLKDGQGTLNGEKVDIEPIKTAQKVASKVKNHIVMGSIPVRLNVKGVALFTNLKSELVVHDEVEGIEIVTSNQLENFIKKIVQEEKRHLGKGKGTHQPSHLGWLARVDRHHPLWTVTIPDEIKEKIQPGIACSYCDSFNVKVGEVFMTCECGGWETTEEATVRTICEYGVLNMNKDLYPPDLHHFFDGQISMESIEKHLAKHFSAVW